MLPSRRARGPASAALLALLLWGLLSGLLLGLLSGCGMFSDGTKSLPDPTLTPSPLGSTGTSQSPGPSAAQPGLDRFYTQKLSWHPCRGRFQCARLTVPLDYAKPAGRTIELEVLKSPAANKKQRIGSLVINPGGPGASAVDFVAAASANFGSELRQAFDLVGFDPRGVGESTPLTCLSDAGLDRMLSSDPDPDSRAETLRTDALVTAFGKGCEKHDAGLTAHVSTQEVARDMDVLRAALGDPRLGYFGFSYGTYLGAQYAGMFPQRVGRMVLDGPIDPSLSSEQTGLIQARGFETALRAYVGHCVDQGGCFLGSTVDEGTHRIRELLDSVDAKPLSATPTRKLTEGYALLGVWQPLYERAQWSLLDAALRSAFAGNGAGLLSLADLYTDRGPSGFRDNSTQLLYAVNCLDHDDGIPSSRVRSVEPEFEKASPTFGRVFAYTLSACENWPVHTGRTGAPIAAKGSPPIMVVGTTRDPATPIAGARGLVRQLDNAVLVTRDGDGHTAYHQGSRCVDTTIEAYLVSGKVPSHEVDCR